MASRRRSKTILEDVNNLLSSSDEESNKDNTASRRRTLSVSHSGRFKEQKRRGVLSEYVFSTPGDNQQGADKSKPAEERKSDDGGKVEANTKHPATTQKEQSAGEKMKVVFETKL